jgi:membrane associated rhomboid family serine protease
VITRYLIALNVLAYLWELHVAGPGMLTMFGTDRLQIVLQDGALWPTAVLEGGQWWRIFTSAFLHAGLLHITLNMISLYVLGRFIEAIAGSWRMLFVYVLSMIASGLGVIYFSAPNAPTLGASGAIFGLFGALFAIGFKLGKPGMQLVRDNLGILLLNLVMTFAIPGISKAAHVAGLIAGFIITFLVYYPRRRVQPAVVDATTGEPYEGEYQSPDPRS